MARLVLLMLLATLLSGCLTPPPARIDGYTPPGLSTRQVGTVGVEQVLKYSGKRVAGDLTVAIDENANTILSFGDRANNEVAVFLDEAARYRLLATLFAIRKLGSETGDTAAATQKNVGIIASSPAPQVVNAVRVDFAFREYGQGWIALVELSGYDRDTILLSHLGVPEGRRSVSLLLVPAAVDDLLNLVEQAPGFIPETTTVEK